jgi:hypothetical protein
LAIDGVRQVVVPRIGPNRFEPKLAFDERRPSVRRPIAKNFFVAKIAIRSPCDSPPSGLSNDLGCRLRNHRRYREDEKHYSAADFLHLSKIEAVSRADLFHQRARISPSL